MIALDAMGGDFAPQAIVQGAINAARLKQIPITLFGDKVAIITAAKEYYPGWQDLGISVVHCTESIAMGAEPTRSIMKKKDSSLVRAVQAVKTGIAAAVVSAGNSGACLVSGTLLLGRARNILRPAIGNMLPTQNGSLFCLDLGGTVDCKPEFLVQFAHMGAAYMQEIQQRPHPAIALLSNGTEPYKGNAVTKKTYGLLENSNLNFIGNLEPRNIFETSADVLVCDGFVGNIMLKTIQGTAKTITKMIKKIGSSSVLNTASLLCSVPLLKQLKQKFDYTKKGGALLLGVQHPFIIAHGCSSAQAIEYALYYAHEVVMDNVVERLNKRFADMPKPGIRRAVQEKIKSVFLRK